MKIKEGGGMDIHKELLAYEQSLQDNGFFKVENIGMCTVFDPEQNKYHPSDLCDPKEYKFIDMLNVGWTAWQAAKAQAVPDLSELQERIAGHQYYHDEHGHMIVDMDDVVKEISGFDSWKAQAVPEGFVLVPEGLTHEQAARISDDENFFETYQTILTESDTSEDSAVILIQTAHKAMIEAQEPAND